MSNYKATLITAGRKYEGSGKTISDALSAIKAPNVKLKGVLAVRNGEAMRERIIMPNLMQRLFNMSGMTREVALKNVSLLFDGV